jgi:hypothetical protein
MQKVATNKELFSPVDDDDVDGIIGVLKAHAQLSSDKPNPYRFAIDAVRWDAGIESSSGGSGFGSLDTSELPIGGRPAFPTITQASIPLRPGQHRRHFSFTKD